jgi:hypothetical protein
MLSDTERLISDDIQRLVGAWSQRTAIIKATYLFRRLEDEWRRGKATSSVTNDPLVYFNMARRMLSARPFRVKAMMANDSLEDRAADATTERAILSIFREFDDRQYRTTRLPWRMELNDQICMGWANVFYGVFKRPDGTAEFRADIWDNMTVFHEDAEEGLGTVIHHYAVSPRAAKAKAARFGVSIDPKSGPQMVSDWYHLDGDRVLHAITIGGIEVLPMEVAEGMTEIPVLIVPVNGETIRHSLSAQDDPVAHMFASILHPIERTTKDLNEWMTMIKNIALHNSQPHRWDRSADGQGIITPDDLRKPAAIIHLKSEEGEEVGTMDPLQLMSEVPLIASILDSQRQRGSIPNTIFADVAADTSGFLFAQLQAAALVNIGPYSDAQAFIIRTLAQAFAAGFRDGNYPKILIKGRETDQGTRGGYFMEEWDPEKIDPQIWLDVQVELAVPRNRIQEIAAMRQANTGTPNLLDNTTLLDEIGGFADPVGIMERMGEDNFRASQANQLTEQVIQAQRYADFYRDQGDKVAAEAYERTVQQLRQGFFMEGGGRPSPAQPGVPPGAGGVQGRNGRSPDEVRAGLQRQPPQGAGLGGRR